eukprot:14990906-Alexandrium_andersonii.AAC.1
MSASLVGSEMCIRDRRCAAHVHCSPQGRGPASWDPQGARSAGEQRPGPVSYTHLTLPTICSV